MDTAKRTRKIALIGALLCIIITGIILIFAITAEATERPVNIKVRNADGDLFYIKETGGRWQFRTGYFHVNGNLYYGHHSRSASYPTGSLATDCFRVRKMYGKDKVFYFTKTGAALCKDTRYIKLNHNDPAPSIRCWYVPGTGFKERYNCLIQRYQVKERGHWKSVGHQIWPYGQIDWQW